LVVRSLFYFLCFIRVKKWVVVLNVCYPFLISFFQQTFIVKVRASQ
jgi:hypothetical protein